MHQWLARHTDNFLLKRREGCVALSVSLFIPMSGYAVAELRRRVMFTRSGLCHLFPFCSFLLIKPLKSLVPFTRLQKLSLCFFILQEQDSPLPNSMSLNRPTHSEELAATFLFFWTTVDFMRQRRRYLISSSGHFFALAQHFSFPLFNLKSWICHSIKSSHLRCHFYNLLSDLTFLSTQPGKKKKNLCSIFPLQVLSVPYV